MSEIYTRSYEETVCAGAEYAATLRAGDVVAVRGEMGAGKTAFIKGVAKGLGVSDVVTSPTYAYMNDYGGKLYHYDCYRLTSGEQAEAMGLTEYFYSDGVCLVEWAENIASALPEKYKEVKITVIGEGERKIEL